MSAFAFWGAVQLALVYSFVALGVYLSFRILDFPDLTVDGSFPLGAAVAAVLIVGGANPWLATLAAFGAGGIAGLITAALSVGARILNLLASILTMFALYSINLRIMGRPNIPILRTHETVITPFYHHGLADNLVRPLFLAAALIVVGGLLVWFLATDFGLAMRAAGANPKMARAQGIPIGFHVHAGMAISNGLVALAGAFFAQTTLFADVSAGLGTIVVGLAAVIVGESLFRWRGVWVAVVGCVIGSIAYRLALQFALEWDGFCIGDGFCIAVRPSDLNVMTAALIAIALILPRLRFGRRRP